ncbi:SMP-30/gluconolactonase/LRE family protein [Nocardioides sp. ChNu-99]|uniref:SMP-30/gluconolactonase/LRE family protein n=1 Tax=Nocardioides sp. ChNu-99 TaxID=2839897 RepID=UPI002406E147|nr:SMP-30/gluconolactonase/LRE family protein [Nocardioides sp. ChNu-99]
MSTGGAAASDGADGAVARTLDLVHVPGFGTEDVLVGLHGVDEGAVFTGTEDGALLRISHDGRRVTRVGHTAGRPLGLEHLPDGRLLVCDARRGLLAVDLAGDRVETLVREVDGTPMRFCNNAAVAPDGTVFFSDSSLLHGIDEWKHEMVRVTRTGRLLRRAPDGTVEVLLDDLGFANGVALAPDGSWVAVAETALRTVVRLWLTGPRAGERDLLADDLPGYPDNIATGSDGLVWIAVASPEDPLVTRIQHAPGWVRRAVTAVPDRLQPAPRRTVRAIALDADGGVVHDLEVRDPATRAQFHMVTGVREHEGRVWLGSLHEGSVARVDL